jgi:misacylated tRNA(Ala) deacylase
MMEQIFRDDAYETSCEATVTAADENGIRLDRTVFYPMGGGQPGDQGRLRLAASDGGGEVAIVDARKGEGPDEVLHIAQEGATLPAPGARVTAEIDWERRYRLMRMHTCLHLLCAVIPGEVTGGQISDGKGRLDFNLPDTKPEKEQVTAALNRLIEENHEVRPRWISDQELASNPGLVRTMSVKPPMGSGSVRVLDIAGVDLQPCGGTHVRHTGEIGRVKVAKIESKGRQNRRVVIAFDD